MFKRNSSSSKLLGTDVWVADDDEIYVEGTVTEAADDGTLTVTTKQGGRKVTGKSFSRHDPADADESDVVQMANVDKPNILHTLRKRHAAGSVWWQLVSSLVHWCLHRTKAGTSWDLTALASLQPRSVHGGTPRHHVLRKQQT